MRVRLYVVLLMLVSVAVTGSQLVGAGHFSDWSDPVSVESIPGSHPDVNTSANDGCPIESPDGMYLYSATNRLSGGSTSNDIFRFPRNADGSWGAPELVPYPVSTETSNDFCPTPVRGGGLFFVSDRGGPGSCGGPDIYFTRETKGGWTEPQNLGCGINSSAAEWSPSYFEDDDGNEILYFASTRTGGFEPGGTDADIYYSVNYEPAQLAPGVNTVYHDFRPNVHRNGREIVFDSDRPGNLGAAGTFDIWTASRPDTSSEWSDLFHLPAPINSPANETRASFSWDGLRLYFGSSRTGEGGNDMYFATRERLKGYEK